MYSMLEKVYLTAALVSAAASFTPASTSGPVGAGSPVTIMATCGSSGSGNTGGAEAKWTVRCNSSQIWIEGWVKDTVADGKCGWVTALYADGSTWESNRACPKGNKDTFSSPPRNGKLIEASLHQG
ncbi:hypothetical protein [Umezawaea tangerina]|uniref:Uncharacterized protein n=1 Tax=Umezawaea tangerina TaxID=84725 RepID=A0A2T0TGA2_9PSEU|nr:hypothetical protein [Umezawaea tangerina]PRY44722.1 hypothetical protein CLV43_102287 [Umezawaea tangerina]